MKLEDFCRDTEDKTRAPWALPEIGLVAASDGAVLLARPMTRKEISKARWACVPEGAKQSFLGVLLVGPPPGASTVTRGRLLKWSGRGVAGKDGAAPPCRYGSLGGHLFNRNRVALALGLARDGRFQVHVEKVATGHMLVLRGAKWRVYLMGMSAPDDPVALKGAPELLLAPKTSARKKEKAIS